jgi:hypothetical protein
VLRQGSLEDLDAAVELTALEERRRLEPGFPGEGLNACPGTPPTTRTTVAGSSLTASRLTAGSATNTNVPAGASTSSPARVNLARPFATK